MSLPLFLLLVLARKNRVIYTLLLELGNKARSQWVWVVQGCAHYFGILELRATSPRPVVLSVAPGSLSASLGEFSVSGCELQTLWVEPPVLFCERPVFLILAFDNHSLCSIRHPNKWAIYWGDRNNKENLLDDTLQTHLTSFPLLKMNIAVSWDSQIWRKPGS